MRHWLDRLLPWRKPAPVAKTTRLRFSDMPQTEQKKIIRRSNLSYYMVKVGFDIEVIQMMSEDDMEQKLRMMGALPPWLSNEQPMCSVDKPH